VNKAKAYAWVDLNKDTMRRNNRRLKLIADGAAATATLTDISGNPSESYDWRHLAAVHREWIQEFWVPRLDVFEMSLAEIRRIELQVRRELYP
jgi:hypothetical protein